MNEVISLLLHLRLIVHVIGNGLKDGGPIFLAVCMLPALVGQFTSGDLWTKGALADIAWIPLLTSSWTLAYVVTPENKFFTRKVTLGRLAESSLRQEVMAGGANNHLINGSFQALVAFPHI